MKKCCLLVALIILVTSASLVTTADNQILIKFASTQPADFNLSPTYSAIYRFKDYVESATNGRVQVELNMNYPANGDEKANFLAVQNGSFQMSHTGDGPIPAFFPPMQLLGIPYLFINEPIAWDVLDGKFGKAFEAAFVRATGVRILAWAENGYRNFSNNSRLIKTPADMAGLKIRTMQNPAHMMMVQALGATALPLSWGDLKLALENGTVDGQENPLSLFVQNNFYLYQKYFTLDEHIYGPHFIWINESFFRSLPQDIRLAILDAAKIYQTVHRGQQQAIQARSIETLKANGVIIYKPTDTEKELFRTVAQGPVIDYIKTQVDQRWIDFLLSEVRKAECKRLKEAK